MFRGQSTQNISLVNMWKHRGIFAAQTRVCYYYCSCCGYFNFSKRPGLPAQMPKTTSLLVPLLVRWPDTRRGTAKQQNSIYVPRPNSRIAYVCREQTSANCQSLLQSHQNCAKSKLKTGAKVYMYLRSCIFLQWKTSFYHSVLQCNNWILQQIYGMTTFDEHSFKNFYLAEWGERHKQLRSNIYIVWALGVILPVVGVVAVVVVLLVVGE